MQMVDVRNQILSILIQNNCFSLDTDLSKLKVGKHLASFKKELVSAAFKSLEELKYVTKLTNEEEKVAWIIDGNFAKTTQEVSLSRETCEAISNAINSYRVAKNIERGQSDKLSISEVDIQSLLIICAELTVSAEKKFDPGLN